MQAKDDAQHQPTAGCSCYNCNKVGHIHPECPHPIKNPLLPQPNRFALRGRGAQWGRGGMVVAGGASGGMVVACGASNTYTMPFRQATGEALTAQQQAHKQYYNNMVFYGEQWVAEQ
eukprot:3343494-Rhodomonas_salina.1